MWTRHSLPLAAPVTNPPRLRSLSASLAVAQRDVRHASTQQTIYKQHPIKTGSKDGTLLSRVSGPTDKPLCELPLGQFWKDTVAKYADLPALISKHEPASQHGRSRSGADDCIRWSYGEMNENIQQLVAGLQQLGIQKGDRVAVLMM